MPLLCANAEKGEEEEEHKDEGEMKKKSVEMRRKEKRTHARESATSSATTRSRPAGRGGGGRIGTAEEPEELKRLLRTEEEGSRANQRGGTGEWWWSRKNDVKGNDVKDDVVVVTSNTGMGWHEEEEEEEQIGMAVWDEEDQLAEEETYYLADSQAAGLSVDGKPLRQKESTMANELKERRLPEVPLVPPWKPSAVETARSALARAKEELEERDTYMIEMVNELFQHDDGPIGRLAKEWERQLDTYGWNVANGISNLGARYRAPHMDARRIRTLLQRTASGELVALEAEEGVCVPVKQEIAQLVGGGGTQDLEARLAYGAHRSALLHGAHVGQKIVNDLVRGWAGIVPRSTWNRITGLSLSPLGAVARKEKVRVVHDLTFSVNGDISVNELADKDLLPPCDIGKVFDKFVERAYGLRMLFPEEHIVMRTSDIAEAFRIKHVSLQDVPKFAYAWKGFIILDLRLQFGYCGAPGHFQRHSSAMIEAHNMTRWDDPCMNGFMHDPVIKNFLTIEEGWDASKIIKEGFPQDQDFLEEYKERYKGSEWIDNAGIYIDDAWEVEVNRGDRLRRSAANMLRVHYEALGYPGQDGPGPISLKKYGGWASVGDLLGLRIDLNKMIISLPQDKVIKARELLAEFPSTRKKSTYKEVMSLIGRLRHYAFCIRPGRYFLRRMINVTLLSEGGVGRHCGRREITLDSEFHADIAWWSKLLDLHAQSPDQYSLPIFAHVRRAADIRVIGDASGSAGGGVITGLGVWWRLEWPEDMKGRLLSTNKTRSPSTEAGKPPENKQGEEKGKRDILTIAHLELLVLVLGVATMISHLGTTRPLSVLALCDNSNAVSWHRKAGARCPKASALIRILGELETRHRVYLNARHLPGVQNTHADAISRLSWTEASSYMRTVAGAEGRPDLARKERYNSETLMDNYTYVQVPESWIKRAYGCLSISI